MYAYCVSDMAVNLYKWRWARRGGICERVRQESTRRWSKTRVPLLVTVSMDNRWWMSYLLGDMSMAVDQYKWQQIRRSKIHERAEVEESTEVAMEMGATTVSDSGR